MGLQTGTKSYDYALEPRSNTVPTRTSKTEERQETIRECGDDELMVDSVLLLQLYWTLAR